MTETGETKMASGGNLSIFQKLEKFSGQCNNDDLSSWIRKFERCCVIAGKSGDDLVKGQLMMLSLSGQALAVAERFEEEKNTAQNFTAIKGKLETVFNSDADKQCKQEEFEKRHLRIDETEEELMLALVKLHRSANPTSEDAELTRNVKRKFLSGIPSQLKRSIFIFCSDPHSNTVSIDSLLEATRKARLYVMDEKEDGVSNSNVNVVEKKNENPVLKAISDLRDSLDAHVATTKQQFAEQGAFLNSISTHHSQRDNESSFNDNQRSERSNRGRGRGRGNRNQNRGNQRRENSSPRTCYNCNQPNHFSRDCTAPRIPREVNFHPLNY